MRPVDHARRLQDFAGGVKLGRQLLAGQRLPREALRTRQQERLDALVRDAAARSPYWRERLAGRVPASGPVDLQALPVLTKAAMMEHFDALVTDPRLRRDELLAWSGAQQDVRLFRDAFHVMTTSGSSGRKGLFVYDRATWRWCIAMFLRQSDIIGMAPRIPRRRLAAVQGGAPSHMSRRLFESVSVGLHDVLRRPVTTPLDELVAELGAFRPDSLTSYPSVLARLADAQLEGRLDIAPSTVVSSSEWLRPEVRDRLREAFGVEPFDFYASTEGLWGGTCEAGTGHHLFEDVVLVESVDADDRPVPHGTAGAKLLVTNLVNRVQPVIRLELTDVMVLDDTPCPCGRTLVRATRIEGRTDDVLHLPGRSGEEVLVLPLEFGVVSKDPAVAEFQVVQGGGELVVRLVPRGGAEDVRDRVRQAVAHRMAELGAQVDVRVEPVAELPRSPGGKLQIVVGA